MQIRLATTDDLAAVTDCARQAYARYVPRMGREPAPMTADFGPLIAAGRLHVAAADDGTAGHGVIGFIVLYPRRDHLHVENVAVLPAWQGRGLGKALMQFAEARARALGLAAVELYTNVMMTENQRFYPARGYAETDRREEDGIARIYYRKEL